MTTTVNLREHNGLTQVSLNGGEYRAVTTWVADAIRGQLAGVELVTTPWGRVLQMSGEWANTAAGCRDVARMLESRAVGLEGNGHA